MYAVVDIETTGGFAGSNGITEVAIRIHDGKNIIDRYETLVNPGIPIPYAIYSLTGISNEMVTDAPSFQEVAPKIFNLLSQHIFVAHNVNFDYSFLRHHLGKAGFDLQTKKLCTVRLGRKILPGLPSYSLGKFCHHLGIQNASRHRAAGDAEATALLFSVLIENDHEGHIQQSLNTRSKEQCLPPNLDRKYIDQLPQTPGVYYFHDVKGKVIYVGKAKRLNMRVISHFSTNDPGKKRQDFLRNVFSISYKECGTELMALIEEVSEIKRLWPASNRSLKRYEHAYGLFSYEDQVGYKRLVIDKVRKSLPCLYTFNLLAEGHILLRKLIGEYSLCLRLCHLQTKSCCETVNCSYCSGSESVLAYNTRVDDAISGLKKSLPTFGIVGNGRLKQEKSIILMENGKLYGTGFLNSEGHLPDLDSLKSTLTPYPSNDYVRNLVLNHIEKHPERMVLFDLH